VNTPAPSAYSPVPGENGDRLGDAQGTIGAHGKRLWIYAKEVTGEFTRKRHLAAWILMVVYLGIPWVYWQGMPLIQLDWPGRKLVLLGNNFWAKDLPLFLPLFFAFILWVFLATARYGRIWCGWACPQTVFLQFVFAPVEKFFEGKATQRKLLDEMPWTAEWIRKKLPKHFFFALIAWWIGNTALAYFWGMHNLLHAMANPSMENWPGLALVLIFAALFYGNFAFFKEQACILICPYARFQSVIPDENTSLIAYDSHRGEMRGRSVNGSREGLGDCTDCQQCVLVCPTGIDIRVGQQLECIGCARCIDACDATMTAWKKPKGLVRYASLRELEGKTTEGIRWRLVAYAVLAIIMVSISAILFYKRPSISIDVIRSGAAPYTHIGADSVQNVFSLHLRNNSSKQRILHLKWNGDVIGRSNWDDKVFVLAGSQALNIPLEIVTPNEQFNRGQKKIGMLLFDKEKQIPFSVQLAGPWGK
jgi:cytochrome c oxidase accessory protein FixG